MGGFSSKMVQATSLLRNRPLRQLVVAQVSALTALYGLSLAALSAGAVGWHYARS